jgi:hypothetical protein
MTKTVHSKASKAATVATFNVRDLEEARVASSKGTFVQMCISFIAHQLQDKAVDAPARSEAPPSDASADLEQLRKVSAHVDLGTTCCFGIALH